MVKLQTDLNNFSVAQNILSIFLGCEQAYGLTVQSGVILPDILSCPLCGHDLSKNGFNECQDRRAKAFGLALKKGRVVCANPGCPFRLNIPQSVLKKWFSKFSDFVESVILSLGTKKNSASKIAQHLEEVLGYSLSEEHVRVKLKELMGKVEKPAPQEEPSGVVVHDEQFVKIKGVDLKRISSVDANNPNLYYDGLHPDRTTEMTMLICQEVKKLVEELRAVVIDGLTASKKAYEEVFVGILVQFCLFHFAKNVRDAYKDEVGYGKGRSCLPLEHLIGFFSILNIFFDHDRELVQLRNLQRELDQHIERINKSRYALTKKKAYVEDYKKAYDKKARKYLRRIRKTRRRKKGIKLVLRTEEQAKQLLEKAKLENVFPKTVQKQVARLERNWENFTHCLRDSTIPPTSNKVEQYYALTLNWVEKNNLQSEEQFYREQKFSLMRRYGISLLQPGIFTDFLKTTFVLLLTFGVT